MRYLRLIQVLIISMCLAACATKAGPNAKKTSNKGISNKSILVNSVFFGVDSAQVNNSYHKLLTINAKYLISHPYSNVQIQGNSSEAGSVEHNQELGMIRAQNVKQALLKLGVPSKQATIISFGSSKQLFASGTVSQREPKDQRADIIYTNLPPYQYKVDKLPTINPDTMY